MKTRLKELFQEQLLSDLDQWSEEECAKCFTQLQRWTPEFVQEQRRSWQEKAVRQKREPVTECSLREDREAKKASKTAVLILAGGQGSRLGLKMPKGCFPLLGKSLFERHFEKIRAVDPQTPLAVLTSSLNQEETLSFFQRHQFFGLKEPYFFSQNTMPLLDEEGRWFWESPGRIAEGPDGNGSVFAACEEAGILQAFEEMGIKTIHIVPVDNPLAEPLDPILSSFHEEQEAELTMKCIRLENETESMGRLVQCEGQLQIAEFAELEEEEKRRALIANTGLLAIEVGFMRKLAKKNFPFHFAKRAANHWHAGRIERRLAWKGERFIVDSLLFTKKSQAICYPREECFAPLKERDAIGPIERLLMERESGPMVYYPP